MAMTPAFSPGPRSTYGAVVGSVFSSGRECLYEQCSLHSALTMPSSVKVGVRPSIATRRSYSSGVIPCSATSAGVITGSPGRGVTAGTSGRHASENRFEEAHAVTRSHQRAAGAFRVRHHSEHVSALADDP